MNGILTVPVGELESWMVEFGIPRLSNKNTWIIQALSRLAEIELPADSVLARFVIDVHEYLVE